MFALTALATACRKAYDPPAITSQGTYLVVEGDINTSGVTTVILSNTVNISSTVTTNPVTGAAISIQSNQGASYQLTASTQPGVYQSANLNLPAGPQYRLSIATAAGQQYYSDYEPVIYNPPIDSVGYILSGTGIQLYVNTHDPSNNTKYFRWDYGETWIFNTEYGSAYITNGVTIVPRTAQQIISRCFASDSSTNIFLGSTADLKQSIVYQNPLTAIPSTSEKLETEYSIEVNQHALSADAYNFWTLLKENTENLGGIFDPQPSNLNSNIHNSLKPAEMVVGFVNVSSTQTRRVFIYRSNLPNWTATYPYPCQIDSDYYVHPKSNVNDVALNLIPLTSLSIPIQPWPNIYFPIGWLASSIPCVDCTIRGTTTEPPFWKY
jgi:hypothetical protein